MSTVMPAISREFPAAKNAAQETEKVTASKQNNLNFLRFFMAIAVIAGHSFLAVQGDVQNDPVSRLTRGQLYSGSLAVNAFFLISGYLIVQSWLYSKGTGDYLKKRCLRIYPGFLACSLLCLFVVGPVLFGSFGGYFHTAHCLHNLRTLLCLNVLDIHPFARTPDQSVDGPLWTIAPEFLCYLLVMGLGLLTGYRNRKTIVGLFAVTWVGYLVQTATHWQTSFALPLHLGGKVDEWPRLITYFMAGMCFYFFRERIRYTPRLLAGAFVLLAASAPVKLLPATLPLCGGYLLFYFAFSPNIRLHRFGTKTDLTYGIYLYGWPLQQILLKSFPALNALLLTALALPLACLAAWLSWNYVEKPFPEAQGENQDKSGGGKSGLQQSVSHDVRHILIFSLLSVAALSREAVAKFGMMRACCTVFRGRAETCFFRVCRK